MSCCECCMHAQTRTHSQTFFQVIYYDMENLMVMSKNTKLQIVDAKSHEHVANKCMHTHTFFGGKMCDVDKCHYHM